MNVVIRLYTCFLARYSMTHVSPTKYMFVLQHPRSTLRAAGKTPLHLACEGGSASLVTLLLDHNANLEAKTIELGTPLMCAAAGGHVVRTTPRTVHTCMAKPPCEDIEQSRSSDVSRFI